MTTSNSRRLAVRVEATEQPRDYVGAMGKRITLVPLTIKRRSNRKLLIAPPETASQVGDATGGLDTPMIKTLGKAFHWQRLLDDGVYATTKEMAEALKLEPGWAAEVLRMALLAPDIVAAIVEGRQPRHLNLHALRGRLEVLPRDWNEQRRLLGMPHG